MEILQKETVGKYQVISFFIGQQLKEDARQYNLSVTVENLMKKFIKIVENKDSEIINIYASMVNIQGKTRTSVRVDKKIFDEFTEKCKQTGLKKNECILKLITNLCYNKNTDTKK